MYIATFTADFELDSNIKKAEFIALVSKIKIALYDEKAINVTVNLKNMGEF